MRLETIPRQRALYIHPPFAALPATALVSIRRALLISLPVSQARRADVLNRGFSGYNTKWALSALPHVIGSWDGAVHSPDLVTIFFGTNDASLPDLNARQHVPVAEYQANLLQMVG